MSEEQSQLVLSGSYLYDNSLTLVVRIELRQIRIGSGDWQDDPEVRDDYKVPTYVVNFETTVGEPRWVGGGQFSCLADAITEVEKVGPTLHWD